MGLMRIECADREAWLGARQRQGIGGSEAAAAIGMSPWMTPTQLWRLKIGADKPKDLSGNAAVAQGVRMEPVLRDFFAATHPEYQIEHNPYDILYQSDRPWLFATLDGELMDEYGRDGILEIKTATPGAKWKEWSDGNMPQNYYIQVLHQLLSTGYAFVCLFACLYSQSGDMTLKTYEIEREDVEDDLAWLLEKESEFWGFVKRGVMPPTPLSL